MRATATLPVYFLLHVPKTAGQTIQLHLERHCQPGAFWRAPKRSWFGRSRGPAEPGRTIAVAGHHLGRSLEDVFRDREIRRVLLLREPLSLHLSLYNYRMMNHLAKGQGTYGFGLYLRALPRDFVACHLLSRWLEIPWPKLLLMSDARKWDVLSRELRRFWFVGAYHRCDRLIAAIAGDLGVPPRAVPQNTGREWQRRVGWRLLTEQALPARLRAAVINRNPIDAALWESWHDAGFNPAVVEPRPLAAPRRRRFAADELLRPAFLGARALCRGRIRGPKIGRADQARSAGDWPRAAAYYRAVLARMPNASGIWVQYGHALKEMGDVTGAEAAYRESLRHDADTADTWLQLGHALKLQHRAKEAAAAYRRALALDQGLDDARDELTSMGPLPAAFAPAAGVENIPTG